MNSNESSREKVRMAIKEGYKNLPPIQTTDDFYDEYFWNDAETIQNES